MRFVQIAADQHEFRLARLAVAPGLAGAAFHEHVNALEDEAIGITLEVENAFAAQDIDAAGAQQFGDPGLEPLRIQRARGLERDAGDRVVMFMCVFAQEVRLDLEDAIEIERSAIRRSVTGIAQ